MGLASIARWHTCSSAGAAWTPRGHLCLIGTPKRVWRHSLHRRSAQQSVHVSKRRTWKRHASANIHGRKSKRRRKTGESNQMKTSIDMTVTVYVAGAASLLKAFTGCGSAAAATLSALSNLACCLCRHFLACCEQGIHGASTSWPTMRFCSWRPESRCGVAVRTCADCSE